MDSKWNFAISGISSPLPKSCISPAPPLSLQIRQLGEEMGAALFRRLTWRQLTDSGALLLEEARRIFDHVERAKASVQCRAIDAPRK